MVNTDRELLCRLGQQSRQAMPGWFLIAAAPRRLPAQAVVSEQALALQAKD